jgi:hypothetical protein
VDHLVSYPSAKHKLICRNLKQEITNGKNLLAMKNELFMIKWWEETLFIGIQNSWDLNSNDGHNVDVDKDLATSK